jgi:hypothetical protein
MVQRSAIERAARSARAAAREQGRSGSIHNNLVIDGITALNTVCALEID